MDGWLDSGALFVLFYRCSINDGADWFDFFSFNCQQQLRSEGHVGHICLLAYSSIIRKAVENERLDALNEVFAESRFVTDVCKFAGLSK